ncbi:MAG: VacJ family lipoprotein [Burkholderiales bacterium]|jgi:phospholipid-binding lipoprotein MlaA|nr:VacJ family lipoprotein [Burkholderiales bacterium]
MKRAVAVVLLWGSLSGCATTGTLSGDDPLEPVNRAMFAVNEPIEKFVMRPVVTVYTTVTPNIIQTIIGNIFDNIGDLFSGLAGVLQGKFDEAGHDFGRVIINTSFGLGGMIDFASDAGIPRGQQDLGMVLAHYGVGPRPYLFVPLLGPMTARDGVGRAAGSFLSPTQWLNVPTRNVTWGLATIDSMAAGVKMLDTLDTAALDRYAFIRNAYLQRRAYQTGQAPYKTSDDEDLSDLFDEEEK